MQNLKNLQNYLKENEKSLLKEKDISKKLIEKFDLKLYKSILYNEFFAMKISLCNKKNYSNSVTSLKNLIKFNDVPILNLVMKKNRIDVYLINLTLIKKVTHSSPNLEINNICGSIVGSDIIKNKFQFDNCLDNIDILFKEHLENDLNQNLKRIINNTKSAKSKKQKFIPSEHEKKLIFDSINSSYIFIKNYYEIFTNYISELIKNNEKQIIELRKIENNKVRGTELENLFKNISDVKNLNKHDLGNFEIDYNGFTIKINVISKLIDKKGSPKDYNIDKILKFLSQGNTIYLNLIVGIGDNFVKSRLISIFDEKLINNINITDKWSGFNRKGCTQYSNETMNMVLDNNENIIDFESSKEMLDKFIVI